MRELEAPVCSDFRGSHSFMDGNERQVKILELERLNEELGLATSFFQNRQLKYAKALGLRTSVVTDRTVRYGSVVRPN